MRIVSGKARGTKLYTLEGNNTRPTLDRVKESLFNILQQDIQDSIFLDLFAGSGAIGLEAASRGAKKVLLCEISKDAVEIINKNIEKTHMQDRTILYKMDFNDFLKKELKDNVDIIYLDPPYQTNYAIQALQTLLEEKKIKSQTLTIIETNKETEIIDEVQNLRF